MPWSIKTRKMTITIQLPLEVGGSWLISLFALITPIHLSVFKTFFYLHLFIHSIKESRSRCWQTLIPTQHTLPNTPTIPPQPASSPPKWAHDESTAGSVHFKKLAYFNSKIICGIETACRMKKNYCLVSVWHLPGGRSAELISKRLSKPWPVSYKVSSFNMPVSSAFSRPITFVPGRQQGGAEEKLEYRRGVEAAEWRE